MKKLAIAAISSMALITSFAFADDAHRNEQGMEHMDTTHHGEMKAGAHAEMHGDMHGKEHMKEMHEKGEHMHEKGEHMHEKAEKEGKKMHEKTHEKKEHMKKHSKEKMEKHGKTHMDSDTHAKAGVSVGGVNVGAGLGVSAH